MDCSGQATLNYLVPTAEALHTYAFDPPDGGPRFNGRLIAHDVWVRDARKGPAPRLHTQGFELHSAAVSVPDFWDDAAVRAHYYPASERQLCALTGAHRAIVFDHTLRRRAAHRPALDGAGGSFNAVREPVGRVHVDFTRQSGPARIRQVLERAGLPEVPTERCAIYGMWRSLNPEPLQDAPLALADAGSVKSTDLVANHIIYPDRVGETYATTFNASHQWFYYPQQTRDEVVVFCHFDAAASSGTADAPNRSVPHSAIENPHRAHAPAQPRQSIELRVLAIF
jgi:hypothetical protein